MYVLPYILWRLRLHSCARCHYTSTVSSGFIRPTRSPILLTTAPQQFWTTPSKIRAKHLAWMGKAIEGSSVHSRLNGIFWRNTFSDLLVFRGIRSLWPGLGSMQCSQRVGWPDPVLNRNRLGPFSRVWPRIPFSRLSLGERLQ